MSKVRRIQGQVKFKLRNFDTLIYTEEHTQEVRYRGYLSYVVYHGKWKHTIYKNRPEENNYQYHKLLMY